MPANMYGDRFSREEWIENINNTLDELQSHTIAYPTPGLKRSLQGNSYTDR